VRSKVRCQVPGARARCRSAMYAYSFDLAL
jgi:hypothetical protein